MGQGDTEEAYKGRMIKGGGRESDRRRERE